MANQTRWYKRDPNAALEGMAVLTLEERGAYNTVLDLIYTHDGSVDDDDRYTELVPLVCTDSPRR